MSRVLSSWSFREGNRFIYLLARSAKGWSTLTQREIRSTITRISCRYTIQQMLSVRTILTVVLRITTVNSVAELSLENWFCGQNLVTRMISYNSMTGPCWKYAAQVNHCCALHDNCYDLQLGRENCDQNFCDCLKRATAPDTCAATELKCLAIKKVGQQAYFDAASYEEPPSFVKIVPHIDGVENDFLLLYQECPQVMLTIKSCSLIANICMKNEEENCEQNLSECVQQAADLQNSQQCREASHQAQMSLKSKAIHRRVRRNIETKSTEATAEDKSSTTPAHTFPPIITSDHYNRHDPFTYGLGVFLIVVIFLIILAFYLNYERSQDSHPVDTRRRTRRVNEKQD